MRVTGFQGMIPKVDPHNLGNNNATLAENCTFQSGALTPITSPRFVREAVTTAGQIAQFVPKTLHHSNGVWVAWPETTYIARDVLKRAGDGSFLFVENNALWRSSASWITDKEGPVRVGIARPCEAPAVAAADDQCPWENFDMENCMSAYFSDGTREVVDEQGNTTTVDCDDMNMNAPIPVAFLYTHVTPCEEESAPSPPTDTVLLYRDQGALVTAVEDAPENADRRRWYVLMVGSDGSSGWFLFAETPIEQSAVIYCPDGYNSQDMLVSELWDTPPNCIDGVALAGDNVTVLWHGRDLYLSEARQPHAYPQEYRKRVDYEITQVVTLTDTPEGEQHYRAVILTTGTPYLLLGTMPEDMEIQQIGRETPHLNPGGAMSYAGVVVYASVDGLYAIQGGRATNLTAELYSADSWRAVGPRTLSLGYHDNFIVALNSSDQGKSFMLPWGRQDNPYPPSLVYLTTRSAAVWFSPTTALHLVGRETAGVYQWRGSQQNMLARWRSGVFVQRGLWHPTAAKVLSYAMRIPREAWSWVLRARHHQAVPTAEQALEFIRCYPEASVWLPYLTHPTVEFKLYAYGDEVMARPVWSRKPFRLIRNRRMVEWQFEVVTTTPVYEVHIQTSGEDLTQEGGHA